MSKIFEALEQAQKERKGSEPVAPQPAVIEPEVSRIQESEIYSFELEMEEEMVNLYHAVESLIPTIRGRSSSSSDQGRERGLRR